MIKTTLIITTNVTVKYAPDIENMTIRMQYLHRVPVTTVEIKPLGKNNTNSECHNTDNWDNTNTIYIHMYYAVSQNNMIPTQALLPITLPNVDLFAKFQHETQQ